MLTAENSAVYAVSDGIVTNISNIGWGSGNVGVVLKHKLSDGSEFPGLYGHVKTSVNVGQTIKAGESFALARY